MGLGLGLAEKKSANNCKNHINNGDDDVQRATVSRGEVGEEWQVAWGLGEVAEHVHNVCKNNNIKNNKYGYV